MRCAWGGEQRLPRADPPGAARFDLDDQVGPAFEKILRLDPMLAMNDVAADPPDIGLDQADMAEQDTELAPA